MTNPTRPAKPNLFTENIPQEMIALSNWVVWGWMLRDGKWSKPPFIAGARGFAKSNDSSTWSDLSTAVADARNGRDGIGFVFTETDMTGIDLDHCIDEFGTLHPDAQAIVDALASYTEKSPSGDGLHIIVAGKWNGKRRKYQRGWGGDLEVYDDASPRYFTVTGQRVGSVEAIEYRQGALDAMAQDLDPVEKPKPINSGPAVYLSDDEILTKARAAKNATKFVSLYDRGDLTAYNGDHSNADAGLCSLLTFWSDDAGQIDRIFRKSALMRDKWDEVHSADGSTYGDSTIRWALSKNTERYTQTEQVDTSALLDKALTETQPEERMYAARELAVALARSNADAMTVTMYATRLKQAKVCGVTEFKETVNDIARDVRAQDRAKRNADKALTDDELRDLWAASASETAYGLEDWRRYDAGVWQVVPARAITGEIMRTCESDYAKNSGVLPTAMRVKSVREMASWSCYIEDERWDRAKDIIVMQNGTLQLETLELREHSRDDYATLGLGYDYDPDALCPMFDYALYSTVPDAADFLQEFAGYCLTTDTKLETAVWMYGPPGSGKSTLLHGLTTMLGDFVGSLGLAEIERSQFALADLPGKRLVVSTEQPSVYLRSVGILNAIVSGEPITVERKFKDAYTITPHAKIAWAMNDLPRVDASSGLFRRVSVIEFPELVGEKFEDLKEQISGEAAGILNWAIVGLRRLRERGRFETPEFIQQANERFKLENDKAALFVAEVCVVGGDTNAKSSFLYDEYRSWCTVNGHKPKSSTAIASEWRRLGFKSVRKKNGVYWQGVGIKN